MRRTAIRLPGAGQATGTGRAGTRRHRSAGGGPDAAVASSVGPASLHGEQGEHGDHQDTHGSDREHGHPRATGEVRPATVRPPPNPLVRVNHG